MGQMPQARDSCESLGDCMHQTALQNGGRMDVHICKVKQAEDHSRNRAKTKKQLQNKNSSIGIATDAQVKTELSGISYMWRKNLLFLLRFLKCEESDFIIPPAPSKNLHLSLVIGNATFSRVISAYTPRVFLALMGVLKMRVSGSAPVVIGESKYL